MNRFAELLDRLAYEPGRNNKLRLITDYLRATPDPERGWALAALTGALSFKHAKAGMLRALIAERTDPVLFALSYDYVGRPVRDGGVDVARGNARAQPRSPPTLTDVVETLSTLGKAQLPAQLARWLDGIDETGRWALLKAGHRRACASACRRGLPRPRRRRSATRTPNEIEVLWPGLQPPYRDLFAWLEGRADRAGKP